MNHSEMEENDNEGEACWTQLCNKIAGSLISTALKQSSPPRVSLSVFPLPASHIIITLSEVILHSGLQY